MNRAAKMKVIKRKNGFTLVECVVAMALLAIMSLLLTMLLNVTLRQRNKNMEMERDLDKQVNDIVADSVTEQDMDQEIVFKQGAEEIEKIPGNGVDGIDANKIYNDGNDSELDALKYDFDGYTKFEDIAKGGVPGGAPGDNEAKKYKLYGAACITKNADGKQPVTLYESVANNGDETWTITLTASFEVDSVNFGEGALKIVLPSGLSNIGVSDVMNSKTLPISKNTVRIEPLSTGSVQANIKFTLTDKEYTETYKNCSYYFTGMGVSNSVIAYMNQE